MIENINGPVLLLSATKDEICPSTIKRKKYNPVQFGLIQAHVTLCREGEMENTDRILENIRALQRGAVTVMWVL